MLCTSWDDALWEGQHFCDIPSKDAKDAPSELNWEGQTNPNCGAFHEVTDLSCTIPNIEIIKDKERGTVPDWR